MPCVRLKQRQCGPSKCPRCEGLCELGRDGQGHERAARDLQVDAETPEERERIADEMIEFSKQLLEAWEKENVSQFQEERAEAKKEAGR